MANPKKDPKKPLQAWKGIPSLDNPGWQFLFLGNPKTGQLVKIEIPKRYAFDKRGLAIPDNVKNAKVKGVKYTMHKKEKHWDALIAQKQLQRLFSAGFIIVPPDKIKIMTPADAKKFKAQYGEYDKARKKRGKRSENNLNNENTEDMEYIFGEDENADGDGEGNESEEINFKQKPKSKDLASDKPSQSAPPSNKKDGQPSSQKSQSSTGESKDGKDKENKNGGDGKDKGDQDNKGDQNGQGNKSKDLNNDRNEEVDDDGNSSNYDQFSQDTEEDKNPSQESTDTSVNESEDSYEEEFDPAENEKAREAAKALAEQERQALAKAKSKSSEPAGDTNQSTKLEESEKKIQQKISKAPRKHRGNRKRLGNRTVAVDRYAKGKSGDGSRVRGIYSYSEVVFNAKVYHAARTSAAILNSFIGRSQALLEYGVKSNVPELLIRLESGDNPIPALEVPQNRPKMKIMISPDCSPSTHDWNGLACAWAIMLAKSPDLDVLFCVNSNGEPVKMSSDKYLTLMKSSDIIIYLGDADGMFHNKAWARDYGLHVIALSSAQTSIAPIPKYKIDNKKVHLIVQKYKRGVLRYVTGVSSKDPRTWVKALNLCMLSLEGGS